MILSEELKMITEDNLVKFYIEKYTKDIRATLLLKNQEVIEENAKTLGVKIEDINEIVSDDKTDFDEMIGNIKSDYLLSDTEKIIITIFKFPADTLVYYLENIKEITEQDKPGYNIIKNMFKLNETDIFNEFIIKYYDMLGYNKTEDNKYKYFIDKFIKTNNNSGEKMSSGQQFNSENETILEDDFSDITKDSFSSENLKDPQGNTVDKEKDFATKVVKRNAQGDGIIEAVMKNTLRAILPSGNLVYAGVTQFTGFDPSKLISGGKLYRKPEGFKTRITTTNLDQNILYNLAPDLILTLSKMSDNRLFRIIASFSPLLFGMVANFKERGNPLKFDPELDEIDLGQAGALLIPVIGELISPYVPVFNGNSISNIMPEPMKGLWGIKTDNSNNVTYSRNNRQVRTPVQPSSFGGSR